MYKLKWINGARTDRRPFIQADLWILALQKSNPIELLEEKNQIADYNDWFYAIWLTFYLI